MPPDSPAPLPHALTERAAAVQTPGQALWRVREYLRPYYGQLILMILAAVVAVSAEIVIPLLTKSVIDNAIDPASHHPNRGLLVELGVAAMAFGLIQSLLSFFRRWVQAAAVAGMEKKMRDDLYAHLQRLEPGFHDAWQSGQLLSRATTDLSAIRRFGGFGVVFFITNIWTFLVVVALLIHLNWWLGLITGGVFLPGGGAVRGVREALPGAVPAGAGRAGRPGDLRRGGDHRHPGAQVAGPPGTRRPPGTCGQAEAGVPHPARDGPAARLVLGQPGPGRRTS